MKIQLKEIPKKGKFFSFNKSNSPQELFESFADLIQDNFFDISLEIKSVSDFFEVSGTIKSQMDLPCSRCAVKIKHPIQKNFVERVFIDGKNIHEKSLAENSSFLKGSELDLGELLRELIAIEEPIRVIKNKDCEEDSSCKNLKKIELKKWLRPSPLSKEKEKERFKPFKRLKELL